MSTIQTPRLRIVDVDKTLGATRALRGVSLEVQSGEVLALIGENGAGKSTLMKILSGAIPADKGQIWLDGERFAPRDPADARAAGVAMIYQELSLAPHLSVMENVLLGVEPAWSGWIDARESGNRAARALAEVGLANVSPRTPVGRLSLAQRQLVEIARAVATRCRVLILDEPTSSLTRGDVERLFALMRKLRSQGTAILYISHFLEEVREIGDRFVVLRDGERSGGGALRDTDDPQLIAMMVGRTVGDLYPLGGRSPADVLLRIENLSGNSKPVSATLEVRRGEIVGIAGLVGSGRTSLLRTIFGLDAVAGGSLVAGGRAGSRPPARRWAEGVGLVSEDRKREGLAVGRSVAENITLPRLSGLGPWGSVLPSRSRRACLPWIEGLRLKCGGPDARVETLSGGNQQKVAMARLLHADVDLFLLDEPTRGIDVGAKGEIYRLLDRLARGDASLARRPKGILVVSSYLPELLGLCDRVAVMCKGVLGESRPAGAWNEHQLMAACLGQEGTTC